MTRSSGTPIAASGRLRLVLGSVWDTTPRSTEAVLTYPGFDTAEFPGVDVMGDLKAASNLTFCGYYLGPAPSHKDAGWMGRREALAAQGWGFTPIYVGQQVTGPGSKKVTAAQGTIDGADAANLMAEEGFPPQSCVFLDLENGPPLEAEQSEYVSAWAKAVAAGEYTPGVYCSWRMAGQISGLVPKARIWAFRVPTTDAHDVNGPPFPALSPASSGAANAYAWQREQNAWITFVSHHPHGWPPDTLVRNSQRLLVDLSVAITPDPSRP